MVSQATEIRDIIETDWSLTGRLSKVPLDNMKEIVRFFDRDQVLGNEWPKAVVVRKINDEFDENRNVHPTFDETIDKYEITLYYRVVDVQEPSYSEALDDIEEMATELQRILKLQWDPSTGLGPYFTSDYYWTKADHVDSAQPELRRTLFLTLSLLEAPPEVYLGFKGVLALDVTDTVADAPPSVDYTYTQVYQVDITEGYEQIPYLTKDTSRGRGVPYLGRGLFRGTFTAFTQGKRSDLEGSTIDKITNIYKTQTLAPLVGLNAEVVFLQSNINTETPTPSTFTSRSFMKINQIQEISSVEDLLIYRFSGTLTKPTEYIFS